MLRLLILIMLLGIIAYGCSAPKVGMKHPKESVVLKDEVKYQGMGHEVALRGTVVDIATGEALFGAAVVLQDDVGAPITGALVDDRGQYYFTAQPGDYNLHVRLIGYESLDYPFKQPTGGLREIHVGLIEDQTKLYLESQITR